MTRDQQIDSFLEQSGYGNWVFSVLTADASFRRYLRGSFKDQSLILMDAPPHTEEKIGPFLRITEVLREFGLRSPKIEAFNEELGFILMEDFGDALIAQEAQRDAHSEDRLYDVALECLKTVWSHEAPNDLASYDRQTYQRESSLVHQWYLASCSTNAISEFERSLDAALARLSGLSPVLVLRDYHAENLIALDKGTGVECLGLLDYQDALAGHPAYDLVSLVEDARRAVPTTIRDRLISGAAEFLGLDEDTFRSDIAILGAQRNLKIIGIFARLSIRDGKTKYPAMIPHVFDLLAMDLAHPSTEELAVWCEANLAPPSREKIASLKAVA